MKLIKSLTIALLLACTTPMIVAEDAEKGADKGEKIEITALPAAVKDGFTKEVPGGTLTSAKKLSGDKVRYQLHYKLDGKEHQITLGEDGVPTRHKKEEKPAEGK